MHTIYQHFELSDDEEDHGAGDGDGEARNPRKRKRVRGNAKRHPWRGFLNLRSLALPPAFQQHLDEHGSDPIKFLTHDNPLGNDMTQCTSDALGDAFMARYYYTLDPESRRAKDGVRWCYTMLMYYDLVKLIKPNGSGRVGCLMLKEVRRFLGPLLGPTTLTADAACKQINKWSRIGRKLDQFCAEFGEGCLFYLEELLSRDL